MSLIMNNQENLALVATELDNIVEQNFKNRVIAPNQVTAMSGDIFKTINWDRGAYYEETMAPISLFEATGELQNDAQDRIYAANKRTIVPVTFTKDVELSKEWFDDNLFNMYGRAIADLAVKAYISQDFNAFGVFRKAFTSTLTNDGVPFVGNHPLIKGGTTSNMVPLNPSLSSTSFEQSKTMLQKMVDQAGVIIGQYPRYLLVPIALENKANQLVQASLVFDATSTNGTMNAPTLYKSAYGIQVKTTPYLDAGQPDGSGSDTAWFLMSENHTVQRLLRQGLTTALVSWEFSPNRKYVYKANYREEYFVSDYVGVVGSRGDNLA